MSFSLFNGILKWRSVFFIDALLCCLCIMIISKGLQGEVLKKLEELVIILWGLHLGNPLVEQVYYANIEGRNNFLNSAVNNSDHVLVLAKLALPKKVNRFRWQRALLSKELQNTSTSFDYFDMGVLSENNFKKFLVQNPIFQAFSIDKLGRLLLQVLGEVKIWIDFSSILRVIHELLPLLLDNLEAFDSRNHCLNLLKALKLLFKVCAPQESERHIELVKLYKLCGLHIVHWQCEEIFKLLKDSAYRLLVDFF